MELLVQFFSELYMRVIRKQLCNQSVFLLFVVLWWCIVEVCRENLCSRSWCLSHD